MSSYRTSSLGWFTEKLRYDAHKEWLIEHNKVGEAAQITIALDERLCLAASARRVVRLPSSETGNWSEFTLKTPTEPLVVQYPVELGALQHSSNAANVTLGSNQLLSLAGLAICVLTTCVPILRPLLNRLLRNRSRPFSKTENVCSGTTYVGLP